MGLDMSLNSKCISNKLGMSLIEVTVSIGILGIMTLAFMSMITNQQQQVQRLEFKSTLLETQTQIISALQKDAVCTNQFSNAALGALKITDGADGKVNLNGATTDMESPLGTKLILNKVLLGDTIGSSTAIEVGQSLPGIKGNPVREIYISDFVKKSAADDTLYTANLYATFDTNPKFGAIKPIKIKMNLKTNTVGITSRSIVSCSSGDGIVAAEVQPSSVAEMSVPSKTCTNSYCDIVTAPATDFKGHNVAVAVSFAFSTNPSGGSSSYIPAILLRNGVAIRYVQGVLAQHGPSYSVSYIFKDSPGVGVHTYTLRTTNGAHSSIRVTDGTISAVAVSN